MKKLFLLSSIFFIISSFGYTNEDTSNANYLADQRIVTKQTTTTGYRLDDKILRQEVIGMALKIKGITLPENYTCKKYFADATKNDWVCRAVELAADNGIITRSNKYANPGKSVTRAEALAMVMSAGGIAIQEIGISEWFTYFDKNGKIAEDWQSHVMETARQWLIINPSFVTHRAGTGNFIYDSFDYYWRHNDFASRAEVFDFTKNIYTKEIETLRDNKYSKDPIMTCYSYCEKDQTIGWDNTPCCASNFENACQSKNGVLRTWDLHPVAPGWLNFCFQKAPDRWQACSINSDCLSGVCDLEYATTSSSCSLIKKEFSGEKNPYYNNIAFYTATYSCTTPSPGICLEAPENQVNPGGSHHSFEMNDKILTEVLEEGVIY